MTTITLHTSIKAPLHIVFDLARSVDLHQLSTTQTQETIVSGRKNGLMELNETVTWRAKHLGVFQTLKTQITEMEKHHYFVDEMVTGAFKSFKHQHIFEYQDGVTTMTDFFEFCSPFGFIGKWVNGVFLTHYMTQFLRTRNEIIKEVAESKQGKEILPKKQE